MGSDLSARRDRMSQESIFHVPARRLAAYLRGKLPGMGNDESEHGFLSHAEQQFVDMGLHFRAFHGAPCNAAGHIDTDVIYFSGAEIIRAYIHKD